MVTVVNEASSGQGVPFGAGLIDGVEYGRSFPAGRKLGAAELQLAILALLAAKSLHGYGIIKEFDRRSGGFYVPSPGMVYPALALTENIGHATVALEGTRKVYHVTDAGRICLDEQRIAADRLFAQFDRVAGRMERLWRAWGTTEQDTPSDSAGGHCKELVKARQVLQRTLAGKWASAPEEQQRVADVLSRAAAEIAGS